MPAAGLVLLLSLRSPMRAVQPRPWRCRMRSVPSPRPPPGRLLQGHRVPRPPLAPRLPDPLRLLAEHRAELGSLTASPPPLRVSGPCRAWPGGSWLCGCAPGPRPAPQPRWQRAVMVADAAPAGGTELVPGTARSLSLSPSPSQSHRTRTQPGSSSGAGVGGVASGQGGSRSPSHPPGAPQTPISAGLSPQLTRLCGFRVSEAPRLWPWKHVGAGAQPGQGLRGRQHAETPRVLGLRVARRGVGVRSLPAALSGDPSAQLTRGHRHGFLLAPCVERLFLHPLGWPRPFPPGGDRGSLGWRRFHRALCGSAPSPAHRWARERAVRMQLGPVAPVRSVPVPGGEPRVLLCRSRCCWHCFPRPRCSPRSHRGAGAAALRHGLAASSSLPLALLPRQQPG